MPDWLIEHGIGETRAALVENGEIVEARVELENTVPAGTLLEARLVEKGQNGRNAVARDRSGAEYLLPEAPLGTTEGAVLTVEIVREAIPGAEQWKRAMARAVDAPPSVLRPLHQRLGGRLLPFPPAGRDELVEAGWDDLIEEATTGLVGFAGGTLRLFATPAMTLIDVDGYLPPDKLALAGAAAAAKAIRRLGVGGSIGIDLPTVSGKGRRQSAAAAIDETLPQPFERTAVNGFGFVQIVRPRRRPSLLELALDRPSFEARALLRRVALEGHGPRRLAAHPAVIATLETKPHWLDDLSRQLGGRVGLRSDPSLPISGGYAEPL